jgi:6-phosphogluconolactonase
MHRTASVQPIKTRYRALDVLMDERVRRQWAATEAANGVLTALPGTVVGSNLTGFGNLDIAVSANGIYLYALNSADEVIGQFVIISDGSLTNLGTLPGLPAGSSLNGIAAN